MLPFVAAAVVVLFALGCFTKDARGSEDTKDYHVSDEQTASMDINGTSDLMTFAAVLVLVGAYCDRARKLAGGTGVKPAAKPLEISPILLAIAAVEAMELTAGVGTPYAGDDLKEGARGAAELNQQLQSARPDDNWRGAAANTYAGQVSTLQGATQACIDTDERLAQAAQHQADWVTHVRLAFGLVKTLLLVGYAAEVRMYYFGVDWRAYSAGFAIQAAGLGVAAGLSILTVGGCASSAYADHVMAIGHEYSHLARPAASAALAGLVQAQPVAAEEPVLGGFAATLAGATAGGAQPAHRDLRTARTAAGEIHGGGMAMPLAQQWDAAAPRPATLPNRSAAVPVQFAMPRDQVGHRDLASQITESAGRTAAKAEQDQQANDRAPIGAPTDGPEQGIGAQPVPGVGAVR